MTKGETVPTRDEQCATIIAELLAGRSLAKAAKAAGVSVRTVNRWANSDIPPQVELGQGIKQPLDMAIRTARGAGTDEAFRRNTAGLKRGSTKRVFKQPVEEIIIDPAPAPIRAADLVRRDSPGFESDRRAASMPAADRQKYSEAFAAANGRPINSASTPTEPSERLGSEPSGARIGQTILLPGGIIGKRMC